MKALLTNHFVAQISGTKFWFQYKFRHISVAYSFMKDLFFALGILICFQYINFQYLELFRQSNFSSLTGTAKTEKAQENIDTYTGFNFIGTIFAGTMLYSLICRVIFNLISDVKLPWDRWTILDGVCAIICLICFTVTGTLTPEDIFDQTRKQNIDYYVAVVVVVSWLRFFAYFLVVRSISKLLMTLLKMFIDTISFVFLMT